MTSNEFIISTEIKGRDRISFLSKCFGKHFMLGEAYVFDMAERLSTAYKGGLWKFYSLSNNGFFMVPETQDSSIHVQWSLNGFDDDMSPDAFGIVVTLFALCRLCEKTESDALVERYHELREYASGHAEARLIFQAID